MLRSFEVNLKRPPETSKSPQRAALTGVPIKVQEGRAESNSGLQQILQALHQKRTSSSSQAHRLHGISWQSAWPRARVPRRTVCHFWATASQPHGCPLHALSAHLIGVGGNRVRGDNRATKWQEAVWLPESPQEESCPLTRKAHCRLLHEQEVNLHCVWATVYLGGFICYSR